MHPLFRRTIAEHVQIQVLQGGRHNPGTRKRTLVGDNAQYRLAILCIPDIRDRQAGRKALCIAGIDTAFPHLSLGLGNHLFGRTIHHESPLTHDQDAVSYELHIAHDMRE